MLTRRALLRLAARGAAGLGIGAVAGRAVAGDPHDDAENVTVHDHDSGEWTAPELLTAGAGGPWDRPDMAVGDHLYLGPSGFLFVYLDEQQHPRWKYSSDDGATWHDEPPAEWRGPNA